MNNPRISRSESKRISSCNLENKIKALEELATINNYAIENLGINILERNNVAEYFDSNGELIFNKNTKPKKIYDIFNENFFNAIRLTFQNAIENNLKIAKNDKSYRDEERKFTNSLLDTFQNKIKENPFQKEDIIKKFLEKDEDNKQYNEFSETFTQSINKIREISFQYFYINSIQNIVYAGKNLDYKKAK